MNLTSNAKLQNKNDGKKKIITIAGNAGSGKSSTADRVADELDYQRFSAGDFMRAIASHRGLTLEELHIQAENDPSIDRDIDAQSKKVGEGNELVIDSRLAFHFIPRSFKVFLSLDSKIAAERIFADMQNNPRRSATETADSQEEVLKKITTRKQSNRRRYQELYNLDYLDQSQFDLVIDTAEHNLEEVAHMIVATYTQWLGE